MITLEILNLREKNTPLYLYTYVVKYNIFMLTLRRTHTPTWIQEGSIPYGDRVTDRQTDRWTDGRSVFHSIDNVHPYPFYTYSGLCSALSSCFISLRRTDQTSITVNK